MENKLAKSLAYWIDLTPDKNRSFKVRNQKCGRLDFSPEMLDWNGVQRSVQPNAKGMGVTPEQGGVKYVLPKMQNPTQRKNKTG